VRTTAIRRPGARSWNSSIEAALRHPGAVLLDFQVEEAEDCYPMMPPGVSLSDTIDQPKVEDRQRETAGGRTR